jgi:DmsE family decaheme c-type cytochrome
MTLLRVVKMLLLPCAALILAGIVAGGPHGLLAQNSNQKAAPAAKPGSINNEDCATCHEDVVKAFDSNPHAILEKSPRYNLKNSCESCHGPGEEHASNSGEKTKIIGFKGTASKEYNKQCLACHSKDLEVPGFGGSKHSKSGLNCTDCHGVHKSVHSTRLLKTKATDLCLSCHTRERGEFSKPYHHRVKESSMSCMDCHQPHSGIDRRQTRTKFPGELACARCHIDKGGPFVFEHASLKIKDCMGCHEPHGSNNAKMLARTTVRSLCLECHSYSRNGLSSQPPSFHDVRLPRYQNCTTCHTKIHGSNSSPYFLR